MESRPQRMAALPEARREHSNRRAGGLHGLGDDGPGVPLEHRAQIFEPFFTTRSGGTGLGLYIARELADANGCALELLPKSPGAMFRLTFKRALTPAAIVQSAFHTTAGKP